MPKSTKEGKPVIIDTVKGKTGTEGDTQDKFFPVDLNGKPIIPKKEVPKLVYDKQGKPIIYPLSGKIVDVEV